MALSFPGVHNVQAQGLHVQLTRDGWGEAVHIRGLHLEERRHLSAQSALHPQTWANLLSGKAPAVDGHACRCAFLVISSSIFFDISLTHLHVITSSNKILWQPKGPLHAARCVSGLEVCS